MESPASHKRPQLYPAGIWKDLKKTLLFKHSGSKVTGHILQEIRTLSRGPLAFKEHNLRNLFCVFSCGFLHWERICSGDPLLQDFHKDWRVNWWSEKWDFYTIWRSQRWLMKFWQDSWQHPSVPSVWMPWETLSPPTVGPTSVTPAPGRTGLTYGTGSLVLCAVTRAKCCSWVATSSWEG